jgi:hypothetical protein
LLYAVPVIAFVVPALGGLGIWQIFDHNRLLGHWQA